MNKEELIERISQYEGIINEYYDVWGNKQTASLEVKEAVLKALGYPVENYPELLERYNETLLYESTSVLEPVYFLKKDTEGNISFRLPQGFPEEGAIELRIIRDGVTVLKKSFKPSECVHRRRVEGPPQVFDEFQLSLTEPLEPGYYSLCLEAKGSEHCARLIVSPHRAYLPDVLKGRKLWGLGVNLFEINSSNNQGIGDLTDLKTLMKWVGKELKGAFVAINPLHATTNSYPFGISPYAPLSRLYLNPIYLDLRSVADVKGMLPSVLNEFKRIKQEDLINYEAIYRLKIDTLKQAFGEFYEKHYLQDTERGQSFKKYIKGEGKLLKEFALFMALYEYFSKIGLYNWADWPEGYKSPQDFQIKDFQMTHEKDILFHKYLQWLLEIKLKEVEQTARETHMALGLYRDIAVGSLSEGADVWSNQDIFVRGCSVGAPPDTFSPLGQNWGFPPISPTHLRRTGYEFFINLIRKNLCSASALRIDHAPGLFRLFWIPDGFPPEKGVYIRYPAEELLNIIALESAQQKAVIIAEDLGTVPYEIRGLLHQYGMFSFRLLYFEKDYSTGEYLPPEAYPELAIVSTTTHDLPTIYGFWEGRDIKIKTRLNRYPDDDILRKDSTERDYDRWRLLRALNNQGLLPEGTGLDPNNVKQLTEPLCRAIYQYLSKTPSKLLMVNLNDLLGLKEQTNLPGTLTEYPNWQRRHPVALEDILTRPFEWLKGLR